MAAQEAGRDFQLIIGTTTGWLPLVHMGVQASIAGINESAPEIMTELRQATSLASGPKVRKADGDDGPVGQAALHRPDDRLHMAPTRAASTPVSRASRCSCPPSITRSTPRSATSRRVSPTLACRSRRAASRCRRNRRRAGQEERFGCLRCSARWRRPNCLSTTVMLTS